LRYCERWIVANPGKHWTELVRPRNWVAEPLDKRSKCIPALCTKTKVAVALEKALATFESDIKQLHCVYEWRRKENDVAQCECPWDDEDGWRKLPAPEVIREHIPFDDQDLHFWELRNQWVEANRLNGNGASLERQSDARILKACGYRAHPILRSTDGGHVKDHPCVQVGDVSEVTAASMVLFDASDSLDDWQHEAPTPMLIRVQRLPRKMGDTLVDNDHGELAAVVLAECVLPTDAVALGIIDSTVARSKIQNLCN
jgi:hypothetical protein